jgi:hypothetical protein
MDPSWDMADMETCESAGGSFSMEFRSGHAEGKLGALFKRANYETGSMGVWRFLGGYHYLRRKSLKIKNQFRCVY